MTDQSQWKATLRKDSDGATNVNFIFDGEHGHIQMDVPAGDLDMQNIDAAHIDELRRQYDGSCIISWPEDTGPDRTVQVGVSSGRILVSKLNGFMIALGDSFQRPIGDLDAAAAELLIIHVRSLV